MKKFISRLLILLLVSLFFVPVFSSMTAFAQMIRDIGATNPITETIDDSGSGGDSGSWFLLTNVPINADLIVGLEYTNGSDDLDVDVWSDTNGNTWCDAYDEPGTDPVSAVDYDEMCVVHGTEEDSYNVWISDNVTITADVDITFRYVADAEDGTWDLGITNPDGVTGLTPVYDDQIHYKITNVDAGNDLTVTSTGADGEIELIVFNDLGEYCYEYDGTSSLTCTISAVSGGTYYAHVYTWSDVTSLDLEAEQTVGVTDVVNGETVTVGDDTSGNWKYYQLTIPSGAVEWDISSSTQLIGGTGDVDLYGKMGSQPTLIDYDYISNSASDGEEYFVETSPTAGDLYIGVYAPTNYTGAEIYPLLTNGDIVNGTPVDSGSVTTNTSEWKYYTFDVPAGVDEMYAQTTWGAGDVTLYSLFDHYPADGDYDDKSDSVSSNDESISIASPSTGTHYIGLSSERAVFENVSLTAGTVTEIINGQTLTGLSGTSGDWDFYKMVLPSGASNLRAFTSGGTVDVDLFQKYNGLPGELNYDNASQTAGNNTELVTVANPTAGNNFLGLFADPPDSYSGVTFGARYANGVLSKGVDVTNVEVDVNGEWVYYTLNVTTGASDLTFTTSGGTGNLALYEKYNGFPSASDYDATENSDGGNNETLVISSPTAGTHYIGLYAAGGQFSGVTLNGDFTGVSATPITNGQTVTGISGTTGEYDYYVLSVPAYANNILIETGDGTGNPNLYTKSNDFPTTVDNEYSSTNGGTDEDINISTIGSATDIYIGVYAASDFSGVSLTVSYSEPGDVTGSSDWDLSGGISDPDGHGANNDFSYDVDVERGVTYDYMIIAAEYYSNGSSPGAAAYIYRRNGSAWELQQGNATCAGNYCVREGGGGNPPANPHVAIDGDYALLSGSTSGVFVYKVDGSGIWQYDSTLANSGRDVAISGNYAVVGDPYNDLDGSDAGVVYVYELSGGTWSLFDTVRRDECTRAIDPLNCANDHFGMNVAVSGDYLIVGAPDHNYDHNDTYSSTIGGAYVFHNNGSSFDLEEKLARADCSVPSICQADYFGYAVDIDGDYAIAGSRFGAHPDGTGSVGSAHIYYRTGTSWDQQAHLAQSDYADPGVGNLDEFGTAVAITGSFALVGAPDYQSQFLGKVFMFERSGATWSQVMSYQCDGSPYNCQLGETVAMDGNDYYGIAGDPNGGSPVTFGNTGGGGGGGVPEFSDYMYILTLIIAVYFMFRVLPKIQANAKRH